MLTESPPIPIETTQTLTYALVGAPNAGKTTLFNSLTGLHQKVANYPGVTVEKKIGRFLNQHGKPVTIIDLPGAYSLTPYSEDEAITHDVVCGEIHNIPRLDRIICVVDASNLERNLYLAQQLAEWGKPVILVLNMYDLVLERGIKIDIPKLEEKLGMVVVPCQANKEEGLLRLKLALSRKEMLVPKSSLMVPGYLKEKLEPLIKAIQVIECVSFDVALRKALYLIMDKKAFLHEGETIGEAHEQCLHKLECEHTEWRSDLIRSRYDYVKTIYNDTVSISRTRAGLKSFTDRMDNLLLHPLWGWCSLLFIMGLLFWSLFSVATYPMQWMEFGLDQLQNLLKDLISPGPIRGLLLDGVLAGVGNVLLFLPQILTLFFFIGLLESSGYMPRAAFMLDGLMSKVGLPGKSFIPLLSSYACAVPGIMATRTIPSRQERFATIMIAPWMSCSSRLPVYFLIVAVLFPAGVVSTWIKAGILVGCYAAGTLGALFMAWVFRKTLLKGGQKNSVIELPPYRMPCIKSLLIDVYRRGLSFVRRVGSVILGFSIILWFLSAYPRTEGLTPTEHLNQSFAAKLGHTIEPVIKPLGYDWKLGVSLLSSFAAREVFVSSMAIVYNFNPDGAAPKEMPVGMSAGCCGGSQEKKSLNTLSGAMRQQKWPDGRPVFTTLTCISLLAFYIFALQCMSTVAITLKETRNWAWTAFQFFYMTGFAYLAAFIIYQGGTLLGFN